jgi:hypothetical protein
VGKSRINLRISILFRTSACPSCTLNDNIYFYKDDLDMFAQEYQIKCREKKGFSFFNIWTRNDILAITITIYIGYKSIFVVCFTDLFLTRINKRWANYVV